jgi:uncharacterized damage-inducible protein DinB
MARLRGPESAGQSGGRPGFDANALLREAFDHHIWATEQILRLCRGLDEAQLTAPGRATYGTILETLNHLVRADAGYIPRSLGARPGWAEEDDVVDVAELEARAAETAERWQRLLAAPIDASEVLLLDDGAYQALACVPIVQALHHGNAHREQVCSLLTSLAIEPPDLQAWAWADATGRAREREPGQRG